MAVKYFCPKCGRRFVDWGAEKTGYKCPSEECEGETLILPGTESGEGGDGAHKEKRAKKRKAILPSVSSDIDVPDLDEEFSEDADVEAEDEVDDEIEDDIIPVISTDDDVVEDTVVIADTEEDTDDEDDTFSDALGIDEEEVELDEE